MLLILYMYWSETLTVIPNQQWYLATLSPTIFLSFHSMFMLTCDYSLQSLQIKAFLFQRCTTTVLFLFACLFCFLLCSSSPVHHFTFWTNDVKQNFNTSFSAKLAIYSTKKQSNAYVMIKKYDVRKDSSSVQSGMHREIMALHRTEMRREI